MNMFSKLPEAPSKPGSNISRFQYRSTNEVIPEQIEANAHELTGEPEVRLTERELIARLAAERAAGFAAAEETLQRVFDEHTEQINRRILQRIAEFEKTQKEYFSRVESEVVQLALAIAGKILHREAQVDPMLLSAIVHLALGQLKEGSTAKIRIRPEQASKWRDYVSGLAMNLEIKIAEDGDLEHGDCVVETELGMVNFSLDAQLKEIERGFLDVLAQKPQI